MNEAKKNENDIQNENDMLFEELSLDEIGDIDELKNLDTDESNNNLIMELSDDMDDLQPSNSEEIFEPDFSSQILSELESSESIKKTHAITVRSSKGIFSDDGMEKWLKKLPDDMVNSFTFEPGGNNEELNEALYEALDNQNYENIHEILLSHKESLKGFGRARRIRLLSILSNRLLLIEKADLEEESEDDSSVSGALSEIGILFLEDIKIYTEKVIKPRLTKQIINEMNLRVANEAITTLNMNVAPKI